MLKQFITKDYLKDDNSLDYELISNDLSENQPLLKGLRELDSDDLKAFFHILLTNKCYKALGQIINWIENEDVKSLNLYKVLIGLLIKNNIPPEVIAQEIATLESEETINLLPYEKQLNEEAQSLVEQAKYKNNSKANSYKTNLFEQVKFLDQQELTEKAREIRQKLEFHFPESTLENTQSHYSGIKLKQSKDLNFSKVIERNLSFNLRAKKRIDKKILEEINERNQKDQDFLNSMVSTWHDVFKNEVEILIAQLEFFSIQSNEIYKFILKNHNDLDFWTKVELLLKVERAFEGLNLISSKESEILDKDTESVYNYYYYKALFYKQIGMNEEADEIFKALYEQKQNFRDIKFYLKD